MGKLWIALILGVGVATSAEALCAWQRRSELQKLNARPSLNDDLIYSFYLSSGLRRELLLEAWHLIADHLRVPSTKLRPSDRFGNDIGRHFLISDRLDSLSEAAQSRMRSRGVDSDLQTISTVDAFVRKYASES